MRLTFLGSGDAFGSGGRFNTSFHLERAAPGNVPGIESVSVDWNVLAFAVLVTGASIALCVLAPVLQSLSRDVLSLLQQGGHARDSNLLQPACG